MDLNINADNWRGIREVIGNWKKYLPLINLVLVGLILFLSVMSAYGFFFTNRQYLETLEQTAPKEAAPSFPDLVLAHDDPMDFTVVSQNNIFSSKRQEWEATDKNGTAKNKDGTAKNENDNKIQTSLISKLIVCGIASIGDEKKALINEPGKEKEGKGLYVKVGDSILGCKIMKIESDRIILDCQGEKITKTIQGRPETPKSFVLNPANPAEVQTEASKSRVLDQPETQSGAVTKTAEPAGVLPEGKAEASPKKQDAVKSESADGPGNIVGNQKTGKKRNGTDAIKDLLELMKSMDKQ